MVLWQKAAGRVPVRLGGPAGHPRAGWVTRSFLEVMGGRAARVVVEERGVGVRLVRAAPERTEAMVTTLPMSGRVEEEGVGVPMEAPPQRGEAPPTRLVVQVGLERVGAGAELLLAALVHLVGAAGVPIVATEIRAGRAGRILPLMEVMDAAGEVAEPALIALGVQGAMAGFMVEGEVVVAVQITTLVVREDRASSK